MTDERHEHEPALDGDTEFTRRMWHAYLTGEGSPFEGFRAFMQSTFGRLPSDPRCKICQVPFRGIGSLVLRSFGFSASAWQMNPNLCNRCEVKVRQDEVGVEVDVTMMFADSSSSRGNRAATSGVFAEVESYDPATDSWKSLPPMGR